MYIEEAVDLMLADACKEEHLGKFVNIYSLFDKLNVPQSLRTFVIEEVKENEVFEFSPDNQRIRVTLKGYKIYTSE